MRTIEPDGRISMTLEEHDRVEDAYRKLRFALIQISSLGDVRADEAGVIAFKALAEQ